MSFRLAYSTNAYMRYDVVEAIRRVAALGYAGVELMADAPHLWPATTDEGTVVRVREALEATGLGLSNLNAFMMNAVGDARHPYWYPSWIEPDAERRRVRREHTIGAVRLARSLGAAHISTEPGGPVEPGMSRGEALRRFAEELEPVVEVAEREEVMVLVEPEPGLLLERGEDYLEFISHVDSPFVGLNFDVGHFFCVGEDPAEAARRLGGHIRHVHVEDIAADRQHEHLIPGRGVIDFAAVFRALREVGYRGWVTVELYPYTADPDAAGREAREVLGRILESI